MSAPFSVERARLLDRLVAGFREDAITDEDFDTAPAIDHDFYSDPSEGSVDEDLTGLCVWCDGRFDPNQLARGESRLHCSRACNDADLADVTKENHGGGCAGPQRTREGRSMSFRVEMTVEVDALTEQEAFALIQTRLRTVDFIGVDFTDAKEIDNDPTAKMERDLAYGGDVRSEIYRDGWRHGG